MTSLEKLHKVMRVEAVVLQIARLEKPTGYYPEWAVKASMQLTEIEREHRQAAKAEGGVSR